MEKSRRLKDRKTTSLDTDQHSSSPPLLPMDLMMDIFSRLSLKSIAICRCVSKQWGYVLGHPDFRDLRLARSQARPRLLFACFGGNKLFFLTSASASASVYRRDVCRRSSHEFLLSPSCQRSIYKCRWLCLCLFQWLSVRKEIHGGRIGGV
ncbi:BnaC04g50580D [Brassica napus]|uniref:BnaC04g50580D protein n=1 Tax=Brassica napus TaxID=3708 RepID=A0A078GQ67_BRANA|nr:BnaC04g50580D [Brassica napus]